MSIFKKIFGKKPNILEYTNAMVEMAAESERTYLGMITLYNTEVEAGLFSSSIQIAVEPTARGIYKARLFGALFMVIAFIKSSDSISKNEEIVNVATGVALSSDILQLDRETAKNLTNEFLTPTLKNMISAFETGKLLPHSISPEHTELAKHLHDALAESIGIKKYTSELKERFNMMVLSNIAASINHAKQWII